MVHFATYLHNASHGAASVPQRKRRGKNGNALRSKFDIKLKNRHRSTKRGQIEKTGTKEITIQGCSYDPKGSFGSEKVGG